MTTPTMYELWKAANAKGLDAWCRYYGWASHEIVVDVLHTFVWWKPWTWRRDVARLPYGKHGIDIDDAKRRAMAVIKAEPEVEP